MEQVKEARQRKRLAPQKFLTATELFFSRRQTIKAGDFKVLLEPDEEAGGYVVSCPALPGCYTQGDTVDQALENIKKVILLCLEDIQAQNQPISSP